MAHDLEIEYGLTAHELLDALQKRFRARVTLEGAVAEVQLAAHLEALQYAGTIARYETHDEDGKHDCSVYLPGNPVPLRVECKNVRNHDAAFRTKGVAVAYKVEVQKTRTSNNDPSSRFYGREQFDILAVCMGKKTRNWKQFFFVRVSDLQAHQTFPDKLAVMHRVPLPESLDIHPWYRSLGDLIKAGQV